MNGVSKIDLCEDVTLVTFRKVSADLSFIAETFCAFAAAGINIDMISQTTLYGHTIDFSFTLPSDELMKVLELVNRFRETSAGIKPMVSSGNCKIRLYGEEMRHMPGVAARAISALSQTGTELMLITTSEVDISLLVSQASSGQAIEALEKTFSLKACVD